MIRLAIDVMGGDLGVAPLVRGAIQALKEFPKLHLILVGDEDEIVASTDFHSYSDRLNIINAPDVVDMEDNPLAALRNKPSASMPVALDMLTEEKVDAVVSAGNTGALVAFGVQKIGMQESFSRPAICTQMPTATGRTWLLDLGATLSATADRYLELAQLGADQCRAYNGIQRPRVGLLNVGVEEVKGTEELSHAANRMADEPGYEYCGYVEGGSIFSEEVDVVVCDGFSGNVAIKTAQGVAQLIIDKLSRSRDSGWFVRLLLCIFAPIFRRIASELNPAIYNGAPLLGLNGLVVKSHGNAGEQDFANAIILAARTLERKRKLPPTSE